MVEDIPISEVKAHKKFKKFSETYLRWNEPNGNFELRKANLVDEGLISLIAFYFGLPTSQERIDDAEEFAERYGLNLEGGWLKFINLMRQGLAERLKERSEMDNALSRFIGSEIIAPVTSFQTHTVGTGVSAMKMPVIVLEGDFVVSKDYGMRLPITDAVAEKLREYFQRNFNIESVSFGRIQKSTTRKP